MRLSDADRELFYRLLWHLLYYASQQLEFLPRIESPEALSRIDEETWRRLRDSLYEHPDLFDSFTSVNPFRFTDDELAIVRSWKGFLRGEFFVWRYLRKYTVFLSGRGEARAYGVVAPNKPFEMMLGPHLPVAIEAVLLPFKGKIVIDGLFASYPVSFGSGVRRMLNDSYREAKARGGIVTSLGRQEAKTTSVPSGDASSGDDPALRFRYWRGFTERMPYKLGSLQSVTEADVLPGKLQGLVRCLRSERLFDLPSRIGLEEGPSPIEVDVLELEQGGRRKRIEVLNRGASLFYLKNPGELQRFHRFVFAVEGALPKAMQGMR